MKDAFSFHIIYSHLGGYKIKLVKKSITKEIIPIIIDKPAPATRVRTLGLLGCGAIPS